jgi:radical SAM protein with 4Fe4S-binding SPASM domain
MRFAGIKDGLNFVSKLSAKKIWNASRVLSSYQIAKLNRNPVQRGLPLSVAIEPTTSCNLRCPECISGLRAFTRPTGMMKEETFRKIIDELSSTLSYLIFYFQGEPFLHPQLSEMVKYAHTQNIYTATSTNGHFLDAENAKDIVQSGLDRIIVSIDGITQEVYEQYRIGGKLDKVFDGVKELVKQRKDLKSRTPHIILQFIVMGQNEHQKNDVKKLGLQLGVDEVRRKTAQVYEFEKGSSFIPADESFSRYTKSENGSYNIKNKLLNHCWKLWHSPVMTWDGNIVPCCFDKDANHPMGNMMEQDFKSIWFGDKYKLFRQQLFSNRKEIDICKNCTEGLKVWG